MSCEREKGGKGKTNTNAPNIIGSRRQSLKQESISLLYKDFNLILPNDDRHENSESLEIRNHVLSHKIDGG